MVTSDLIPHRTWDEALMTEGCRLLLEDLPLASDAPGGMVEYRHSLTISFFFKFYMAVLHKLSPQSIPAAVQSVVRPYHRPHTRGTQGFQMVPDAQASGDMVGRPMMHQSAIKQATGEARCVLCGYGMCLCVCVCVCVCVVCVCVLCVCVCVCVCMCMCVHVCVYICFLR